MPVLALLHASRASLEPLMGYYPREAPEWEFVNLLDDGILRLLARGEQEAAAARLGEMLETARVHYGAGAGLVCCSALSSEALAGLAGAARVPVVKIDLPLAEAAVAAGRRLGVLMTFPATRPVTFRLLEEAATRNHREVELIGCEAPAALTALLAGDAARHRELLLAAADELAGRGIDALVLAQVSMGPFVGELRERLGLPVFSSLETSLAAVRRELGAGVAP